MERSIQPLSRAVRRQYLRLQGTRKCAKRLARRVKPQTTWTHQTSPGFVNLVLEPSYTTSGETSICVPWIVAGRAYSTGICLAKSPLNLGYAPTSQQWMASGAVDEFWLMCSMRSHIHASNIAWGWMAEEIFGLTILWSGGTWKSHPKFEFCIINKR